jgi:hypothetical protein
MPTQQVIVVLDTNVLRQHQGPSLTLRVIFREVRAGRMQVAVPEVVIREAANSRAEDAAKLAKTANTALGRLVRMGALDDTAPTVDVDPERVRAEEEHKLRALLVENQAEILDIPKSGP